MNDSRAETKVSRPWAWAALVALALLLFFSVAANLILVVAFSLFSGQSSDDYPQDEKPRFEEIWSYGSGTTKVARIAVTGIILRKQQDAVLFGKEYDFVEQVQRQVRAALNDEAVRAIILEIDSPGGEITAVDEIYSSLIEFRQSRDDRVIVAYVKGLAASGGYYISASADRIIAEPTAVLGSISAIMQTLNWKELSDKIGVHDVTIKTGSNKDLMNPFQEIRPEQVALMQELLDSVHERFLGIVAAGRDMEAEQAAELADGRIFTADQALDFGLIDGVGYWNAVTNCVRDLLNEPEVKIVKYEEKAGFMKMFSQLSLPISRLTSFYNQPRLMFLWAP